MTTVSSSRPAVYQKRPQLTAVSYTAVRTYRGTLKQDRGVFTVESCGFGKVRYDRGELRDLKTTIFHGIIFYDVLITNRDLRITVKGIRS